jgi:L-iditol 2-dehydrogenase
MSRGEMRAAVLHGKEDVRIERLAVPRPGAGELLVRNRVALTCGTDAKVFRRGYHARMIVPPAVFGHELAGVVEEAGEGAPHLRPGTPVVVANSAACGGCDHCRAGRESLCDDLLFWNGAYAEYSLVPARIAASGVVPVPEGVPLRHAALTEPLACVVRGIAACRVAAGQSVAVIGVGPVGLMLLALARERGAQVVAAGRRRERLARALALGASAAVPAAEADLAGRLRRESPAQRGFDVVIDAAGSAETADAAIRAARKGGVVNLFAGCPAEARVALDAARLHYEELTITSSFHHTPAAFREALALIAGRRLDAAAFITDEAPLERLPEVLRRQAHGEAGLKTAILPWGE